MKRAAWLTVCLMACSGEVTTLHVDARTGAAIDATLAVDGGKLVDAPPYDATGAQPDGPIVVPDGPTAMVDAPIATADAVAAADDAPLPMADAPLPMADAEVPAADAAIPPPDAPLPPDAAPPDARAPDASAPPDAGPPDAGQPDAPPSTGGGPTIGGCAVFPPEDPWNQKVDMAKVDAYWTGKLIGNQTKTALHPDFGDGFGIPYDVVPMSEPKLPITFDVDDESDPGPYPYASTVRLEGGTPTSCDGDCHVIVVQQGACIAWEAYLCQYFPISTSWNCYSGAKFDLTKVSPGQRPKGWTSADAAGLSILAGLVRPDEVAAGHVDHAIRFTYHCTQDGFVYPASHKAVPVYPHGCPEAISSAMLRAEYPPMGTRIRLKSGYSTAGMPTQARIIAEAMKTYGMILADNGSDWFFQGDDNAAWDNDQLDALKAIPSNQFEVLEMPAIER